MGGVGDRLRTLPAWAGQVFRFGFTGGLGFAVDASILWLMIRAGLSPYSGRVVSLSVGIIFTWWLHRRVTFRTTAAPSWREFGAFLLQSLAGSALNYAVYSGLLWAGAPVVAALVVGTGVAAVFNFFRYRTILG